MWSEMQALLKVSLSALLITFYARFIATKTPPGYPRLLLLLPAISPLFFLPLLFSSVHLRAITGGFLAWLAAFKFILLSFNSGPLLPSLPFLSFLPIALLPVNPTTGTKPPHLVPTAVKAILLSLIIPLYSHRHNFPHHLLLAIYSIHIYLLLELLLSVTAFLATVLFGLNLDPQFNAPYLSTSLQDFWGRRWNLMVTGILRPSVYNPVRARWGTVAGVLATFFISGVMHELFYYYVTLARPTGEVLCFFVLHGGCVVVEVWVKKRSGEGGMVRRILSTVMTLGFMAVTAFWLFFPQLTRNGSDRLMVEESMAVMRFFSESIGLEFYGTKAKV